MNLLCIWRTRKGWWLVFRGRNGAWFLKSPTRTISKHNKKYQSVTKVINKTVNKVTIHACLYKFLCDVSNVWYKSSIGKYQWSTDCKVWTERYGYPQDSRHWKKWDNRCIKLFRVQFKVEEGKSDKVISLKMHSCQHERYFKPSTSTLQLHDSVTWRSNSGGSVGRCCDKKGNTVSKNVLSEYEFIWSNY